MLPPTAPEGSVGFRYADLDPVEPPPPTEATLDALRRFISYVKTQDRCRLTLDCLYLALGDADLECVTMADVAAKHGITKAAVSKRTKKIRRDLHLPINANNKSAKAVRRYSETNRSPLRLDRAAPRRV